MDGDGYDEPYIITLHKDTGRVVRIVKRFEEDGVLWSEYMENEPPEMGEEEGDSADMEGQGEIISITPEHYFTKYEMMPSLDDGYYGNGYGGMLEPINNTVDTLINQLIDSGTLRNQQAGFLSSRAKIKAGGNSFRPGEWKMVDTRGGTSLRDSVMALPTVEPSSVLVNMAMWLLESGEKLASITDVMMGESPGANVPASTTISLIEQGSKVYGNIVKRLYRAMTEEFNKMFRLNRIYLDVEQYMDVLDEDITEEDALADWQDEIDIKPIADPAQASRALRLATSQAIMDTWGLEPQTPRQKAILRYHYEAVAPDIADELMPPEVDGEEPQPTPQEQAEAEMSQLSKAQLQADVAETEASVEKKAAETELTDAKTEEVLAGIDRDDVQVVAELAEPEGQERSEEPSTMLGEDDFK